MPDGETTGSAGPPPRWIPAFLGISLLLAPLIWYTTGSPAATVISVLYFLWWAWTIPLHYHVRTDIPKTEEWASKTSRAHVLAVPGLAVFLLVVGAIAYKALGLLLSLTGFREVSWYTGEAVSALAPYALSLPVVTAAILWHSTVMLGRMTDKTVSK